MTIARSDEPWAPRLAAVAAAFVGLVNIASALTPNIGWRGQLPLELEPVEAIRMFHALALPAGAGLLLLSPYLWRRRHRAAIAAIVLLLALALLNILKGLDYEEALLCLLASTGIYATRASFDVDHNPITARSAVWRVPLLGLGGLTIVSFAAWAEVGRPAASKVIGETWDLVRYRSGPLHFERHTMFHDHVHFSWIPLGVHAIELATLVALAYALFRPLAGPRTPPPPDARRLAADLVRAHGHDSLSFFKLRADKQYLFNAQHTAFVGYRVEAGVMTLSGDPVGPPEAFTDLLVRARAFARARGLRLAAVGASERLLPIYRDLGLRSIYLGDEAVLETSSFSLEGRPIRKVRQSVTRLRKAGYTSELRTLDSLRKGELEQIQRVLDAGRHGAPERGFSMAMDSIRCDCECDTVFVLGRDGEGTIRGVLHFVPCYGRPAVSLSFMRRDPETPNGLMEFLVADAALLLRERGVHECSLNFATAARFMYDPSNMFERAVGHAAKRLNRYFQIESLYRFNAKFFPRWEPRYAIYEGRLGLPRMFLASMWAEGQLPKPRLARRPPDGGAAGRRSFITPAA
jgi:lysyl-tRNA synthetase class 2